MLNPQQMAAVKYIDGPLLVLAGAGSGKTRVITQKIAYLLKECSYKANQVYAITFTNKAANEMRDRVMQTLPSSVRRGLKVLTFHTLGLSILKREAEHCGLRNGFSIFDAEDSLAVLRSIATSAVAKEKEQLLAVQRQISAWKNDLLGPETVLQHYPMHPVSEIYERYQQALRSYNAVDFDDLIRLPVELLQKHAAVLEHWQNRIRYLLIDEYQDSNTSQYALVQYLVGVRAQITVVGDDDQSIYAWRGARPENLARLQKDYPHLKIIKLEQNYRSTGRILHAANHLIANNAHLFEKRLWSELGAGDLIRIVSCADEQAEAEQVVADLISHHLRSQNAYGAYAILYRGNHQSRLFEKVLRHHGVPYRLSGGQSWFAKSEVKDLFAYFKLLCNETDDAAFLRVINTPKRGIGDTTLQALGQYAQRTKSSLYSCCDHLALQTCLSEKPRAALQHFKTWLETFKARLSETSIPQVLRDLVNESGYEAYLYEQSDTPLKAQKRMDNVWELIDWVGRLLEKDEDATLTDVINKLILIDVLEQSDEADKERVQLMTLHASKGLEFPFVYLTGMEEEILPHRVSMDEDQIDEERRLAYVGITRAQQGLCLTLARRRRRAGELQDCLPSRFLEELPKDSLEWFGLQENKDEKRSKAMAQSHLSGLKSLLS